MNMLLDTIHRCTNGKVKISACVALEKVLQKTERSLLEDNVILHEAMRVLAAAFLEPGPKAAFRDQRALETQIEHTFKLAESLTVTGQSGFDDDVVAELREKLHFSY